VTALIAMGIAEHIGGSCPRGGVFRGDRNHRRRSAKRARRLRRARSAGAWLRARRCRAWDRNRAPSSGLPPRLRGLLSTAQRWPHFAFRLCGVRERLRRMTIGRVWACVAVLGASAAPRARRGQGSIDPFARATLGFPACPEVTPPLLEPAQARNRRTFASSAACAARWMELRLGGAYKRDPEINEACAPRSPATRGSRIRRSPSRPRGSG
jgi:hypothetical protein